VERYSNPLKALLTASQREIERLKEQLTELREILEAIQQGELDALINMSQNHEQIFILMRAEEPYRLLVEQMSQGAVTLNLSGTILYCNQYFATILNLPLESLISSSVYQFVAPEDQPALRSALVQGSQEYCKTELVLTSPREGKPIPFHLEFKPLKIDHLQVICLIATDLTEQKEAENKLKATLQEREILLKELHHRVKNNLQIISSLLKLQAENIKDEKLAEMFYESQNRVRAMALIHQKLYQSKSLSQIDISVYIQSLVADLIRSLNSNTRRISVEVKIEEVLLNMDTAIPCGLIINELFYNSIKYAFPGNRQGVIRIELTKDGQSDELSLTISDNGIGLPENLDYQNTETLGLQLVGMLTRQLDGSLELQRGEGTTFNLHFRELPYRERI